MIDLDALRGIGLFRELNGSQLSRIQPLCEIDVYKSDDQIIAEGDKAEDICFVLEGVVDIRFDIPSRRTSKSMTIDNIMPGKSFGWSAMGKPFIYVRSAFCGSETCKVGKINADKLRKVFDEDNAIGYAVMTVVAGVVIKHYNVLRDEVVNRGGWA